MQELVLPPAMIETATAAGDWVLVMPLVLALMGAALALMCKRSAQAGFAIAVIAVVLMIACEVVLLQRVAMDGPLSMTMGKWLPPFGIAVTADILGACFALTASIVTLVVLVYAHGERASGGPSDRFHSLVLALLAGVTGSFLTGDFFNLYVWFEVMLIASFGLMVLGGKPMQLDGTLKYGFLNFLATTLFLLSLGLLYGTLGTLNMADILQVAPSANSATMAGIAALLLVAFGMKAAAFPLNAWLPASYHTPPAVISALMAGLLTKVGVFALLRAMVMLLPASRDLLEPVLLVVAVATLVIAPLGTIAETNLRRAIGFLVIGGIGAVLVGITLPSAAGLSGSGAYIFHAILSMTALYLVAGLIERVTGQTDTRDIGGLYAANSWLSILFFTLVLASAGVPPFLGFWPKLLLIEASVQAGGWTGWLLVLALLVNAVLTLVAGARLWAHMFWRNSGVDERPAPVLQRLPQREALLRYGATGALVLAVVAAGLWPNFLFDIAQTGAADLMDPGRYVNAVGLAGGAQ